MTSLLICPTSLNNLKKLIHTEVDGFIVGINNYSVFYNFYVNLDEVKEIIELTDKEIYVALNKPLYNSDIENIKYLLKELSKLNIKGVLYEDISIVNINRELNLNLNLVWNQIHLPTNYLTCNYWHREGIQSALLSTELTLQDFFDIKKNSAMKLMVYIYGYLPMFESSRELITNYLTFINKSKDDNTYYLYEPDRDKYYPIYENNNETYILDNIMNGIREIKEIVSNNIDYIILNGLMHDDIKFEEIVDCYIKALKTDANVDELYNKININDTGFMYKETIYKVKP